MYSKLYGTQVLELIISTLLTSRKERCQKETENELCSQPSKTRFRNKAWAQVGVSPETDGEFRIHGN